MESNKLTLADIGMENAALHDKEVLQRFIGDLYRRLQKIEIKRMSQPEKKFTGKTLTEGNTVREYCSEYCKAYSVSPIHAVYKYYNLRNQIQNKTRAYIGGCNHKNTRFDDQRDESCIG